ncbi:MAG: hypothetical protein HS101_11925 [Planctomycetia bacterium]|jgi:DNA-damage-inducible protein D|nr:hypothetical protein [Planctomycetia bacterium]MCC7316108.1 hypothetical protein [Planctomycetota bacterium]OQZ00286.1 MAG: hypothetical protein B6D36_15405 [Planctomycetes bacterium UTPLA1]
MRVIEGFEIQKFESLGVDNPEEEKSRWLASDLMKLLGYSDAVSFNGAINRAIAACATLNISVHDNFEVIRRSSDGNDYWLSRFGCYLTVMNGDVKKPAVAKAQAYFISIAEAVRQASEESENVERVILRRDIAEREKSLSSVARRGQIENYARFQDAGYRGMYNMSLWQIKQHKGISKKDSLIDHMGRTELAANVFRLTQTEEKIRRDKIMGQLPLETAAREVGGIVRDTMIEISGAAPEDLKPRESIKKVRSGLKKTQKKLEKVVHK